MLEQAYSPTHRLTGNLGSNPLSQGARAPHKSCSTEPDDGECDEPTTTTMTTTSSERETKRRG